MSVTDSSVVPAAPARPSALKRIGSVAGNQIFVLVVVFFILYFYFGSTNSRFYGTGETFNLLVDFGGLLLLAIGEAFVIVSGGIDLSIGSTIALSGVVGAQAMNHWQGHMGQAPLLLLGALVCLGVGALVGAANAFLINVVNLVPFVATLATLSAVVGLADLFSNNADIGDNQAAIIWSTKGIWVFSWEDLIVLAIAAVLGLFLHFSRFGRYTFAIGSNPFAARAAGINIKRHISWIYVLTGALAGLVGMYFYIRLGTGSPTTGATSNLQAIACVVIGGFALNGGSGNLLGAVVGCGILTLVSDGLYFRGVSSSWYQIAVGAIIAVAMSVDALRKRWNRR